MLNEMSMLNGETKKQQFLLFFFTRQSYREAYMCTGEIYIRADCDCGRTIVFFNFKKSCFLLTELIHETSWCDREGSERERSACMSGTGGTDHGVGERK